MTTNLALEGTIDKILKNTENDVLSSLKSALDDSQQNLDDSVTKLENEYEKIISDGKKEADKIEKQIVGSSDIEARNKQLLALESAVDRVFTKAIEEVSNSNRSGDYSNLIKSLLDESTKVLGTSEVIVFTNSKDREVVQSTLSNFSGSELSSETIECIGGVKIQSKDGAMKFDNTIDAKIDRLKPLIRKEIASKFGVKE
ncbi:MAG TPA: V-type ATP synthase subunit E [Nitrosopumilus sp.]|nr:V-type ATP synthase subunit E [Nitrosopumilus sp.]